MGKLDGKITIVTGATSGIGRRTVEIFVKEGARVLATGRREELGRTLEQALGKDKCVFVKADATQEADVKAMIDACLSKWGRLDCLFNNAGGPAPVGGIETVPVEGFDAAMATLVRSVMLGMKHAAPVMMKQGAGSIINNGSVAARRAGYSTSMIYGAAKAAVNHLTVCAAMQLGEKGVRCNSISPGGIATGIFAKALGLRARQGRQLRRGDEGHHGQEPADPARRPDRRYRPCRGVPRVGRVELHQRPRPGGRWRCGRRPHVDAAPGGRQGDAPGLRRGRGLAGR